MANKCLDECMILCECKWPWPCYLQDPRLEYDKNNDNFRSISKEPFLLDSVEPIKTKIILE